MSTIMERFYNHNVRQTPLFEEWKLFFPRKETVHSGISLQRGAFVVRYGFSDIDFTNMDFTEALTKETRLYQQLVHSLNHNGHTTNNLRATFEPCWYQTRRQNWIKYTQLLKFVDKSIHFRVTIKRNCFDLDSIQYVCIIRGSLPNAAFGSEYLG